ncbi:MAG: hypothetical protein AAF667_01565 [Pseudomonadota bacterium]
MVLARLLGGAALVLAAVPATAQTLPVPPAADLAMPYTDRHLIDISNLRDFYNGLLVADAMIHADGMFDSVTKWHLTLRQMIGMESNHQQARAALQLSLLGVPTDEIRATWSANFVDSIEDPRRRAAFRYIDAVGQLPTSVTADTHARLRTNYTDRQIAELFDMAAVNTSLAVHDQVLPVPTDAETLAWALENLAEVGWAPGPNVASSEEEQRVSAFVGATLSAIQDQIYRDWQPHDIAAINPEMEADVVNILTGYDISPVTFDGDFDGIEEPFDAFPLSFNDWKTPEMDTVNAPAADVPPFDVAAYDHVYFSPAVIPDAAYPYSDRAYFDTEWTRQSSLGTLEMDAYLLIRDRAIDLKTKWSLFFVYQLASGCVHCQVHGAFGVFQEFEDDYIGGEVPPKDMPAVVGHIQSLMDIERSSYITEAERAALRLARDAGAMPAMNTAAHIAELRRHYTDREIQEILATLVLTGWLATSMQSQATVTDRLSMSWAMRNLSSAGWKPGVHIGLPNEQRPYHMSELFAAVGAQIAMGKVTDAASDWLGVDVPLAIDGDGDGVEDAYDGFPDDPGRWADTDRDGIEDDQDADIDGDGISNTDELAAGTFPYKADSDGDGQEDAAEALAGTNPVDPRDF